MAVTPPSEYSTVVLQIVSYPHLLKHCILAVIIGIRNFSVGALGESLLWNYFIMDFSVGNHLFLYMLLKVLIIQSQKSERALPDIPRDIK